MDIEKIDSMSQGLNEEYGSEEAVDYEFSNTEEQMMSTQAFKDHFVSKDRLVQDEIGKNMAEEKKLEQDGRICMEVSSGGETESGNQAREDNLFQEVKRRKKEEVLVKR
ncbi:hypothetical protein E2562_001865 [Oryza meyeriana var. granulata]|uniref:Uncharacterized protein n=1 Tax=Oryza meyeriana var. granulata TaxID=110450 RepID=A0A6G1C4S7_9ORYZ|nr:hypothetical protein E2562_001865 [Oryza meyeriana var. granulata]